MKKKNNSQNIYRHQITIPAGVTVEKVENLLIFTSALGITTLQLEKIDQKGEASINIEKASQQILVESFSQALVGLLKSLLENKLIGVSRGYLIYLQIVGVGYRVSIKENTLFFKLGYSHDITYKLPTGLRVFLQSPTSLCLFGLDKNQLTQIAASIRNLRKPEAYKGKGIRLLNEKLNLKPGKRK